MIHDIQNTCPICNSSLIEDDIEISDIDGNFIWFKCSKYKFHYYQAVQNNELVRQTIYINNIAVCKYKNIYELIKVKIDGKNILVYDTKNLNIEIPIKSTTTIEQLIDKVKLLTTFL